MRAWRDNVPEMPDADTSPCPHPLSGQPGARPALSTQSHCGVGLAAVFLPDCYWGEVHDGVFGTGQVLTGPRRDLLFLGEDNDLPLCGEL